MRSMAAASGSERPAVRTRASRCPEYRYGPRGRRQGGGADPPTPPHPPSLGLLALVRGVKPPGGGPTAVETKASRGGVGGRPLVWDPNRWEVRNSTSLRGGAGSLPTTRRGRGDYRGGVSGDPPGVSGRTRIRTATAVGPGGGSG